MGDKRRGVIGVGAGSGVGGAVPGVGLLVGDMHHGQFVHEGFIDRQTEMHDRVGVELTLERDGIVAGLGEMEIIPYIGLAVAHLVGLVQFIDRQDGELQFNERVAAVLRGDEMLVIGACIAQDGAVEIIVVNAEDGLLQLRMIGVAYVDGDLIDRIAAGEYRHKRVVIDTGLGDLFASPEQRVSLAERVVLRIEELRILVDTDRIDTVASGGRSECVAIDTTAVVEASEKRYGVAVAEGEGGVFVVHGVDAQVKHIGAVAGIDRMGFYLVHAGRREGVAVEQVVFALADSHSVRVA